MATSGSTQTGYAANSEMYLRIEWSRVSTDADRMQATYNIKAFMGGPTDFVYRCYAYDSINLFYNNEWHTLYANWYPRGSGTYDDPKYGYISKDNSVPSAIDAKYHIDNWVGGSAWVMCQAHLVDTNFTVNLNDDGNASFIYNASLTGYNGRTWVINNTTVTPDTVDVYSKTPYKDTSWNHDGRIWHKESGVWRKRKLFKRENGSWRKI